jgi:hypothetical protein
VVSALEEFVLCIVTIDEHAQLPVMVSANCETGEVQNNTGNEDLSNAMTITDTNLCNY